MSSSKEVNNDKSCLLPLVVLSHQQQRRKAWHLCLHYRRVGRDGFLLRHVHYHAVLMDGEDAIEVSRIHRAHSKKAERSYPE